MTIKQRLLRSFYPLLMRIQRQKNPAALSTNPAPEQSAPVSFYTLHATTTNSKPFDFASLQGKYVLLVNTASECGYTAQYAALQALQQQYAKRLVVLGFPANDFGGQEPAADGDIARFCQLNFGVSFPLMQKASVTGAAMQPVFQWLSKPALNGWNDKAPTWNFCKYLVNEEGKLLHFFPSTVDPLDACITKYLS